MTQMDTGLRHRLRRARRQIEKQHEQLGSLHLALEVCVSQRTSSAVQSALERLLAAVDAHFEMEHGVFFPALHGLHPDSGSELKTLTAEHEGFRARFEHLRDEISRGSLEAFAEDYRDLSQSIAEHEAREERLVAALVDSMDPS